MDFKKRFDYSDINNFLPDNFTAGTTEFYRNKIARLPDEEYLILEAKTREEYNENDVKEVYEQVNKYKQDYASKILKELAEREDPEFINAPVENEFEKEMNIQFTNIKNKFSKITINNDL